MRWRAVLTIVAVGLALSLPAVAADGDAEGTAPPAEATAEVAEVEADVVPRAKLVADHGLSVHFGFALPGDLAGIQVDDRENLYSMGATGELDSRVRASGVVAYRRGLFAARLAISGRSLTLIDGNRVLVRDGLYDHIVDVSSGGGYLSVAALAGVRWEPQLWASKDGVEGVSLIMTALGGYEHVSLWGEFKPEFIPNYRHPSRSFHWIVERERVEAEVGFRWRHVLSEGDRRHRLGLEIVGRGALLVHIPYLSTASDAIAGVKDAWGEWDVQFRVLYEFALPWEE